MRQCIPVDEFVFTIIAMSVGGIIATSFGLIAAKKIKEPNHLIRSILTFIIIGGTTYYHPRIGIAITLAYFSTLVINTLFFIIFRPRS